VSLEKLFGYRTPSVFARFGSSLGARPLSPAGSVVAEKNPPNLIRFAPA
jgi:hypothetical protein